MAQATPVTSFGAGLAVGPRQPAAPSALSGPPQGLSSLVFTSFLFLVSLYVWVAVLSFSIADWPGSLLGQYPDVLVAPAPQPAHNLCGQSGVWVAYQLFYYFGVGTYILAGFLSFAVLVRAFKGQLGQVWFRGIGAILMITAVAAAFAPGQPLDQMLSAMSSEAARSNRLLIGNGGVLGLFVSLFLLEHFGTYGWLILAAGFLVGILLAMDDMLARTPAAMQWVREHVPQLPQIKKPPQSAPLGSNETRPSGNGCSDSNPIPLAPATTFVADELARVSPVTLGAGAVSLAGNPVQKTSLWSRMARFLLGPMPPAVQKPSASAATDNLASEFVESYSSADTLTFSDPEKSDSSVAAAPLTAKNDEPAPLIIGRPGPTKAAPLAPPVLESDLDSEQAQPAKTAVAPVAPPTAADQPAALVTPESKPKTVKAKPETPAEAEKTVAAPAAPDKSAPAEPLPQEERLDGADAATAAAAAPPALPKPKVRPELIVRMPAKRPKPVAELVRQDLGDYQLPAMSLLEDPDGSYSSAQEAIIRQKGQILQDTLNTFRIDARVVRADSGPVITMFEVEPAPGVRVSEISRLANDIARAMSALTIRIVAPLPGKNTVGIEVPNANKEKVRLKELFQMMPDAAATMNVPVYLGKDASGNALVTDLTKWPHGLVAGTTGSGKSVCINTIVMSVLLTQRPDTVKLILVDPKMVEMTVYKDVPHLLSPIITDMNKAAGVLDWAVNKMEERYALLAEAGVRDIKSYNKLGAEKLKEVFQPSSPEEEATIPVKLPFIVIIIDEFADLMLTNGKEIENYVVRLAQKARAVGIHLILATQRPDANVVTGLIKSNMPTRIAFRVAGRNNSRIVLDQNGAEVLLGQGDMLFLPPGATKLLRAQGTFIEDSELHGVLEDLKGKAKPEFSPELLGLKDASLMENMDERDDLFDEAVRVVLETKRGSVSLLQRKFGIGYGRASRLIDQMGEAGILGSHKNAQAREVCMTLEEYEAICTQAKAEADAGYAADQEDGNGGAAIAHETEVQREARENRKRQAADAEEEDDSSIPSELKGEERG